VFFCILPLPFMPLRLLPGVILAEGTGKSQLADAGNAQEPGMNVIGLCLTGILVLVLGKDLPVFWYQYQYWYRRVLVLVWVPIPSLVKVLVTGTFTKTVITHMYW
jgi:hypothetical protein